MGSRYPLIVGNPSQVADALIRWIDEGGIDGFYLTRILKPQSYRDFFDLVLPDRHPAARWRPAKNIR